MHPDDGDRGDEICAKNVVSALRPKRQVESFSRLFPQKKAQPGFKSAARVCSHDDDPGYSLDSMSTWDSSAVAAFWS